MNPPEKNSFQDDQINDIYLLCLTQIIRINRQLFAGSSNDLMTIDVEQFFFFIFPNFHSEYWKKKKQVRLREHVDF